ncbi:MAG TPA: hypothetical protein VM118_03355, partial [Acidobacteriota bacterium]|nr:hypothetical protein [Acidobacteriota bacterium]
VIGSDAIGTVNAGPVAQTELTLTTVGTGRIVARYSATIADTSGLITCTAGAPAYIVISPDTGTVTTDATLQFGTDTYDADGNPAAAVTIDVWTVIGDVGSISAAGLLSPSTPGTGRITAAGGGLADTTGTITVLPGLVQTITASPDSAEVSADSSVQYTVTAFDGQGNATDPGKITWSLTEPVGTIDAAGSFEPTTVGEARVAAVSNLGPTDTTAHLRVIAGQLAILELSPDSVETTVGETRAFAVSGSDADGNAVELGTMTWAVIGNVGTIDAAGVFTATAAGTGRIAATSVADDVTDTNRAVVVTATDLTRLIVSPDTASVTVGSSLGFTASGYTSAFESVTAGKVTWEVLGGIGTIDADGSFTATNRGTGRIAATRTVDGVTDTSGMIVVDILTVANVPLGSQFVHAGQTNAPLLAFAVENHFATAKGIVGLTLHDVSRGFGTASQIRSNIDSVLLYVDSDANGMVGPSDVRLAAALPADETIKLTFGVATISPFSQRQLLAAVYVSDTPCDGDSLDVFLLPVADIHTSDGSIVGGADSLNSLGFDIIDGLVGDQITLRGPLATTVTPAGGFQYLLSLDIPRNGYREDTLGILALSNAGTATEDDLDSVALFLDDGDGVWDDADRALFAGAMLFTGGQWEVSGAAIRLTEPATVFHVAAVPSPFATDGRTLVLGVPLHGVEMFSANDGPIDAPIPAVTTVTIATSGAVEVDLVPIAGHTLIPGEHSGPILGLSLTNNSGTAADLDSLHLTLVAADPDGATQAQLDSQIDSVMLWLKRDADYSKLSADDSLLAVSAISEGAAAFDLRTLRIAANGGRVGVTATVAVSRINGKNGNEIGLRLNAATDLFFNGAVLITGDFPLENAGAFTIDAFPAAAMTVNPMAGRTLFSGQNNQAVLDFELPRDGYSSDYLSRLRLVNRGTSEGKGALARVSLWADAGGDGFTQDDIRLGDLIHLNGAWEVSGLAHSLTEQSTRFIITVGVSQTSFEGGTLQFAVPVGGVTFMSGTAGPDDVAVMDVETYLVFPASRITAISIPQSHTAIAPAGVGNALMTFALYNGYVEIGKTLQALTLTNRSQSRSSAAFADHELGQVSLFADTNGNRVLDDDLLLASGHLSDGILRLTGLTVVLPSESLSYFFVTSDAAVDAIDGDSLAVCIDSYADLEFNEAVNINGDVPITGTGMLIVDGSVSAQYTMTADPPAVLSPGDSGVVLLGFTPAINGDREDTLEAVSVIDVVSTGGSVIASLSLWRDADGDDALGSADERLGTFASQSGTWVIDGLSLPIAQPAPGLLVVATIASAAEAGASVRLAVPVLGCRYASDNDGPRDHELVSPAASVVSTAALRVAMPDLNASYTVGQSIALPVAVTNVSLAAIDNVVPAVIMVTGDTCVTLDSARTSGQTIAPGETEVFGYYYTAASPGSVAWSLRAASTTTGDSSVVLQTPSVAVQSRPDHARVRLINSMPPAVTRGQNNVFPMTIAIGHPDTAATAAPLRLDSLVVHVWDAAAQDIPFNTVAGRLALATGLPNLTVLEQVPADASVSLVFPQPLLVAPGRQRLLSLLIDIPEDAALVDFQLGLAGADALPLRDANTLEPVLLDSGTVFPMRTAGCHIHDAAQRLAVSSRSLVGSTLNHGQRDVAVLQLNVRHPAEVGSSRIQLSSVSCEFVDADGDAIPPSDLFDAVRVLRGGFVLGAATNIPVDSQRVHVTLSSPLVLNADESDSVRILVSLKDRSAASGFSVIIRDSTAFAVRDVSS